MKRLLCAGAIALLTACGTAVKTYDRGPVNFGSKDMAPVMLVYKFKVPNDQHEIFFWDENKNRYNLKVDGKIDTTKGVLFYLPTGRAYALSGFLHVRPAGRAEFFFGDQNNDLQLFNVRSDMVTQIPYFEIDVLPSFAFSLQKSEVSRQDLYQAVIAERFGVQEDKIRAVKAY